MRVTDEPWSRRRILTALGGAGVTGIAGCSVLDDESNDGESPPGTEFAVTFDSAASNYTIAYEGDRAFDDDNTGLLAIDHVTETETIDRMLWFGGPGFEPIDPGQSSLWGYDAQRVTALEIVWAPPGAAGSGRAPEVLARHSTP